MEENIDKKEEPKEEKPIILEGPKQEESKQQTEEPKKPEEKAEMPDDKKDVKENKFWAALSYLGVLVLIPLLLKRESSFAQFHAKQGLVILIGWILSRLPFGFVFAIIAIILSILGLINALRGEKKKLPVIGEFAEKIDL
jgi:uncharacterized membrane protein